MNSFLFEAMSYVAHSETAIHAIRQASIRSFKLSSPPSYTQLNTGNQLHQYTPTTYTESFNNSLLCFKCLGHIEAYKPF